MSAAPHGMSPEWVWQKWVKVGGLGGDLNRWTYQGGPEFSGDQTIWEGSGTQSRHASPSMGWLSRKTSHAGGGESPPAERLLSLPACPDWTALPPFLTRLAPAGLRWAREVCEPPEIVYRRLCLYGKSLSFSWGKSPYYSSGSQRGL